MRPPAEFWSTASASAAAWRSTSGACPSCWPWKHILKSRFQKSLLLPPVVIGHDIGVPILVEPTLAKLLLLLLLFPHHPAAWQYTSLKSKKVQLWNYLQFRDPAGPGLCSWRPFGSLDFVLRAQVSQRYTPDIPKVSPRYLPEILQVSKRYPQDIPTISPRYPHDIPKIS